MSVSKDFIFDTLKYIPIKILPAFAGILTLFFLTKKGLLNNSTYVDYTFIMATLLVITQIVSGWVNSSVLYYYSNYEEESAKNHFVFSISYLQLLFAIGGGLILFLIIFLSLHEALISVLIVFILLLQAFLNFNYSFFQAKREIKQQLIATLLQALFQICGVLICYRWFKGSLDFFIFFLFSSYFLTAVYLFLTKKVVMQIRLQEKIDFSYAKEILAYGLPICLWFFSTQVYQIGDRILFQFFHITKEVGNYVSFRDLSVGLSGFISMPLLFASHPLIMQLSKKPENKTIIEKMLRRNIFILTAIFVVAIVIIFFFGTSIIEKIVGSSYLLQPIFMVVVLATILLSVISIYLQKGIEANGKTFQMLKVSVIVAVIGVSLNLFFIRKYGVFSAIYIALMCQFLYCVGTYFYSRKTFKIFF